MTVITEAWEQAVQYRQLFLRAFSYLHYNASAFFLFLSVFRVLYLALSILALLPISIAEVQVASIILHTCLGHWQESACWSFSAIHSPIMIYFKTFWQK